MSCRRVLLGLMVAALVASPAFAQPPEGGRRGQGMGMGGGGGMMLLGDKGIQEDLKLTEEQVSNIKQLQAKQREDREALRDVPREEMREKMQEMTKKYQDELNKILNADQQKRLKQLSMQSAQKTGGWSALAMMPEVQEGLALTDEQKEAVRGVMEEMREAMREAFQGGGGGGNREEMQAKMAEMRKGINEKVEKILTDAQKSKVKEMLGEPYKGEFPRPGRRPGGGGQ